MPAGGFCRRAANLAFLSSIGSGNPSATATCLGLTTAYAIGTASGAGQEVFNALDSNISPEHVLENGLF